MQKLFQNKNITQKIIIALVIVILFNFMCPMRVQALSGDDFRFISKFLIWGIVRLTDIVQWIMLFCLTGDVTAVMGHAEWYGIQDNHDNWVYEVASTAAHYISLRKCKTNYRMA